MAQNYQHQEYKNQKVMQTEEYQRGNNYQKDFLLFMELLQTTHPTFALGQQCPFDTDSMIKTGYQHLKTCNSLSDFKYYLSSLIAPLHDGHTFIGLFQENDMSVIYPMQIWHDEKAPYIFAIEKEHEASLEKEIISINGLSIANIYRKFGDILVADNDLFLKSQIFEMILLPTLWNFISTNIRDSLLHLNFYDGTSIQIKAKNIENIGEVVFVEQKNQNSEMKYKKGTPFYYTVLEKERLAYLQFNECVDQNSICHYYDNLGYTDENGNFSPELEAQFQQYPRFDTLLIAMFSEIKSKGITNLVIDVRNNSGGNSMLCRQLLSYLIPNIDNIKTINESIRISDYLIQYYPQWYENLCKNLHFQPEIGKLYSEEELSIEKSLDKEDTIKEYFTMNDDPSLIFKGRTIFMQGKKTYSSAGDLLMEARDNKIGTIIGENSTYRPCNYGDMLSWKLPNTEISGGISHKYFTRPNKSKCHESYLAPDIYIPMTLEDYKTGTDPCWEWIKNNFSKLVGRFRMYIKKIILFYPIFYLIFSYLYYFAYHCDGNSKCTKSYIYV